MSQGFLSRMAKRARGAESSLRPLVLPLFAPPAPGLEGLRIVEETVTVPAEQPLENQARSRPHAPTLPAAPPEQTLLPRQATRTDGLPPTSVPHGPVEPAPPSPVPLPYPNRVISADLLVPQESAPPERHRITAPFEPSPAQAVRAEQAEPPARRSPTPPTVEVRTVEKLLLPLQPPAQPVLGSPTPGSAPESTASDLPEKSGPPPVRISIGRVEVRAVQAAPGAPANGPTLRPEPHPGMSLDEYLRRLNEGNR